MDISDIIKKNKMRTIPVDKEQINKALELCKRDLNAAELNLKNNLLDWSFNISYNSILQAARALMYSYGYAPYSEDSHKTTLEFVECILGAKHSDLILTLNRIRKKRHIVVYDEAGIITKYEADFALKEAKKCVKLIEEKIKKKIK